MSKTYDNAVIKYNTVIKNFVDDMKFIAVGNWKQFRKTSFRISKCYKKNRWFIIADMNVHPTIVAIIDDQQGLFIVNHAEGYRRENLEKMYNLCTEASEEAYNYSKCEGWIELCWA